MTTMNVHEAKTHFSKLLRRVAEGEEVVIARGGKPVARLIPYGPVVRERALGEYRDSIRIADDFDAPLPADVLDDFDGGSR